MEFSSGPLDDDHQGFQQILNDSAKIVIIAIASVLVLISFGVCLWQTSLWFQEKRKRRKLFSSKRSRTETDVDYHRIPKNEIEMNQALALTRSFSLNSDDFNPLFSQVPIKEEDIAKITLGKIEFSCSYFHPRACFRIIIHRVTCYPVLSSVYGNAFLYCVISLIPECGMYFESDMQPINEDNLIDEMCEFDISLEDALTRKVLLTVFICDKYSMQKELGRVEYSIHKEGSKKEDRLLTIEKLVSKELQRSEQIAKVKEPGCSEILVSLCYMPTSGRLTIVALKGKNFHLSEQSSSGVYMKISLLISGRTVKSTQTTISKKILQPVYNEAFVFGAPLDKIRESNVIITVLSKGDNDTNTVLGRLIIGLDSDSKIGRKHWETMLFTARKPVAQWHVLSQFL